MPDTLHGLHAGVYPVYRGRISTAHQGDRMNIGDRVQITSTSLDNGQTTTLTGTVKRIWGNRAANVTVITDDGRTFVRLAADVTPIGA
jgi:hypothetical protein